MAKLIIAGERASDMQPGALTDQCLPITRLAFVRGLKQVPNNVARAGLTFVVGAELRRGKRESEKSHISAARQWFTAAVRDYKLKTSGENMLSSQIPNPFLQLFLLGKYQEGFRDYSRLYSRNQITSDVSLNDSTYYEILAKALKSASLGEYVIALEQFNACLGIEPNGSDISLFKGALYKWNHEHVLANQSWLHSIGQMRILDNTVPHYDDQFAVMSAYLWLGANGGLTSTRGTR